MWKAGCGKGNLRTFFSITAGLLQNPRVRVLVAFDDFVVLF
jgi:hypothetical protein